MNNKQILSTHKTKTHVEFVVKVSIPRDEMSEELVDDVCNMFNQTFPIPVERYIEFVTDEEGKERIRVIVEPKV